MELRVGWENKRKVSTTGEVGLIRSVLMAGDMVTKLGRSVMNDESPTYQAIMIFAIL